MRLTTTSVICAFFFAISGCASGPSQADLAKALRAPDAVLPVPAEQADCVAKLLKNSTLSDNTLNAIATNDQDYDGSDTEAAKLAKVLDLAAEKCQ